MPGNQRLGKNSGGYFGDRIDIRQVLREDVEAARQFGWQIDELPVSTATDLLAFRRFSPRSRRKAYISTGVHGDEPAGPLAVRQLLQENLWPDDADVWICPCLNPGGFERGTRENTDGVDLNRDYRTLKSAQARAHVAWLERRPRFDVALCLHEDWESSGFYVYELNPDLHPPLSLHIIEAVAKVCPIDLSAEIEGRPSSNGIINPNIDPYSRPDWPEAFYLITHKTRQSCTLEAPSDFPVATRVAALLAGVRAALEAT